MHLLEYHKTRLEYLRYYKARREIVTVVPVAALKEFTNPSAVGGYGDKPITDDLITDIYHEFSNRTRTVESEDYLRTLTGQ
jgi:hypothetical protein